MTDTMVVLDPAEVAQSRVELPLLSGEDVGSGIRVDTEGIDWGDAAIQAFMSDLRTGSIPLDYRIPNRSVKIPVGVGMDDFGTFDPQRQSLQAKIGLFQREGGWLKRVLQNGTHVFADVVNATLTFPDRFGDFAGLEDKVILNLECLPDFYGDEITLDTITGAAGFAGVLKSAGVQALIKGDMPGRVRINLTNNTAYAQVGAYFGWRSRRYDPAATAALLYEAEALTPLDAASVVALTGASGGSVIQHSNLSAGNWVPVMDTTIAGVGEMTHRGTYEMLVRVYSSTNTPALRLLWAPGDLTHPVVNDQVSATDAGDFYVVSLGVVRLDTPPAGLAPYYWRGVIQAMGVSNGDDISIDKMGLRPLDETEGWAWASSTDFISVFGGDTGMTDAGGVVNGTGYGAVAWTNPAHAAPPADGNAAECILTAQSSNYLKATGFGFNIPTGATIRGISSRLYRGSSGGNTYDDRVRLVRAGTVEPNNKAKSGPWIGSWGFRWDYFGGASDLWGAAWAPADINDSGFGVAISAYSDSDFCYVDAIQVRVFYTTGGGYTLSQDALIYPNRQCELRTEGNLRQDAGGTGWIKAAQSGGDHPRIPPSGPENRPVELFIRTLRGDSSFEANQDSGLDSITGTVSYRPSYLFRP